FSFPSSLRSEEQMADVACARSWGRPAAVVCAAAVAFLVAQDSSTILSAQGPAHYIVTFRAGTNGPARARAVANAGGAVRFNYNRVNAAAVAVPNERALAALQSDPSVLPILLDRPAS